MIKIVNASGGLNLRSTADGLKLMTIPNGEKVEAIAEESYTKVRYGDSVGFVASEYLEDREQFESNIFDSVIYRSVRITGSICTVEREFIPAMDRITSYARHCDVFVYITSSLRDLGEKVDGAIVKPASHSCHLVGCAIDMNVEYRWNIYGSKQLNAENFKSCPEPVRDFINCIRSDLYLRWGGDFNTPDEVHIDNNLYNINPTSWHKKLQSRLV